MKPKVDQDKCTGCGTCVALCPDLFEMRADGKAYVIEGRDCSAGQCDCQATVDSCPSEAISLEE